MPQLRTYAVFISHAWAYHDDYDRLERMLSQCPNFLWRNLSVPRQDPLHVNSASALEQDLRDQIQPASVVVILAGMYVAHSRWIQKEIDIAVGTGKPILGIRPWGQERLPVEVQRAAREIVGWNTDAIVEAIRRLAV